MPKLKALHLNPFKKTLKAVEIENDLDSIYKTINCDTIAIAHRYIEGKKYLIVCDENACFKENQAPSILTYYQNDLIEIIVGEVLICGENEDGDLGSLTDSEIEKLKDQSSYILGNNGKTLEVFLADYQNQKS